MFSRHIYKHLMRPTCSGSREYLEKKVIFDPDGNMRLEAGRSRDRYSEIQSYKDSTDVNMLIKRYENGDATALLRDNTGAYCDLSSVPRNIHEAVKLSRNVESLYNNLGDDFRSKYSDLNSFVSAFANQDNFNELVNNTNLIMKERLKKFRSNKEVVKEVNNNA